MAFKHGSDIIIDDNAVIRNSAFTTQTGTLASTQVKIKPASKLTNGAFGLQTAVGCGRIVIGSPNWNNDKGRAWLFDLNGNELKVIEPSDLAGIDRFGSSVSIGSGRILISSAFDDDRGADSGSAYIFDLNGNQIAKILAPDGAANDQFGRSRSASIGSGRIVVGAYLDDDNGTSSGSAYIYKLNGTYLKKIRGGPTGAGVAGENFGSRTAIGQGRIAVCAASSNKMYIFNLHGDLITTVYQAGANGGGLAIGCGRIVVGANNTSAANIWIYDLNGNLLSTASPSDGASSKAFGFDVAISQGYIYAGAFADSSYRGSFYQFDLNGTQIAKIQASDGSSSDAFAYRIAAGNGRVVAGSDGDDDDGLGWSGSAYIYKLSENMDSYVEDVAEYYRR